MKKKNQKKIKFNLGNNFALWVMIILGSFFIVQFIPNSLSNTIDVGYDEYRNHLINGKINQIKYDQDNYTVLYSLKDDENKFKKYSSAIDDSEKDEWLQYGVKIDFAAKPGIGLIDVIFNIAPWLLIIGFWLLTLSFWPLPFRFIVSELA